MSTLLRLFLATAVAIVAVGALTIWPVMRPHPVETQQFTIQSGWSLKQVLARGFDAGVIHHPLRVQWLARGAGFDKPKAGAYHLPPQSSDWTLVQRFDAGNVATLPVTVPEGLTATEIGVLVGRAGICDSAAFVAATTDPELRKRFDIPATEVEGYLFPETYRFAANVPATHVVETMLEMFFDRLPSQYAIQASAVGLSRHEAVILASIIEKETQIPEEMPVVSAVFHNRLQWGMRLQADPTAIYRMPNYDGNLTRDHLRTRTPYNTYRISGLPAGPIANPGRAALIAAVSPANTDVLYFVARPDGTHVFARDYSTHRRNVQAFQLGGR